MYSLERPQLPKEFARLEGSARKRTTNLYLQQSLCVLYNTLTHNNNPRLHAVFEFQQTTGYIFLLLSRNLLIDGEAMYLAKVAELHSMWHTVPGAEGSAFPFTFTEVEREEIQDHVEGTVRGTNFMSAIKEALGELFSEQGIVRTDRCAEAMDALSQMKEQVMDTSVKTEEDK